MEKYIDLGLPSGTLWASENEEGFYTYDKAVEKFRNKLPTKGQCKELIEVCQWEWDSAKKGCTVTGPNGNSIFLPAAGYQHNNGNVGCEGLDGYYWSSTPIGLKKAFNLYFDFVDVAVLYDSPSFGHSVRLIKNK